MEKHSTGDSNNKEIFRDNAYKLHERGFSFTPLEGKRPIVNNWPKFASEPISDMVFESWEAQYPKSNLGLITGKQSGIVAIDYDAVVEIKAVTDLIPRSIVERFGKKGFVRFFRYNGEKSRKFQNIQVELFSDKGQVVLPPSIHPDTQQEYKWTSYKTIYDLDDIEELDFLPDNLIEELEKLEKVMKKKNTLKKTSGTFDKTIIGRNNTLFEICSAMVGDKVSKETIKDELINFDKNNHPIPWFSDPTEYHKGDVDKAVDDMINRVAALDKSYVGDKPLLSADNFTRPTKKQIAEREDLKDLKKDFTEKVIPRTEFPAPTGVMKSMVDFCLEISYIDRPKFALASACELIGLLLSNKVTLQGTSPCLYQLLIAESGEGKDVPLKFPKEVLLRTFHMKYIGMGTYRGDKSVVKRFDGQLERIDTIDEVSKLFKSMNAKGGQSHLSSVGELLTEIWSCSNKFFEGFTTSEETVGLCFSPCLSFFGATTPEAFSNSFASLNIMQGFGARFLYVFEDDRKATAPLPENLDPSYVPGDVKIFVDMWANKEVKHEKVDISGMNLLKGDSSLKKLQNDDAKKKTLEKINKPKAMKLKVGKGVKAMLNEAYIEFGDLKYKVPATIKPLVLRAYQNMVKLTQIHWASRVYVELMNSENPKEGDQNRFVTIEKEDVAWAKQFIYASLCEASRLFDETIIESKFHRDSVMIKKYLKSKGGKASKTDMTYNFRKKFRSRELYGMHGILTDMLESGMVEAIEEDSKAGRKSTVYKLI